MVVIRAVRGATQVAVDSREELLAASRELVSEVLLTNDLDADHVISSFFTATRDLVSAAPALAARQLGLHEVALICAQEMWVEGSMPRVVRLLAHVETGRSRGEIHNVYLRGTQVLRSDVPPIVAAAHPQAAQPDDRPAGEGVARARAVPQGGQAPGAQTVLRGDSVPEAQPTTRG